MPSRTTVVTLLLPLAVLGCSKEDPAPVTGPPADVVAPTVSLNASTDSLRTSGNVTLTAAASDEGAISSVSFYEGATLLAVKSRPRGAAGIVPAEERMFTHDVPLTSADNGPHSYHAVALDGGGNTSASNNVDVAVLIPSFPRSDGFDDGVIDPLVWIPSESGGPLVDEQNGRVELTVPSTSSGASFGATLTTVCKLIGDFDIQVDYELLEWPANAGVRMGFTVHDDKSSARAWFFNDFTQDDSYVAQHGGSIQTAPATGMTGTLRMTRAGDTWTSYYWDGAMWAVINSSIQSLTDEYQVRLQIWGHDASFSDQQVRVAFDDFTLVSGTVVDCD